MALPEPVHLFTRADLERVIEAGDLEAMARRTAAVLDTRVYLPDAFSHASSEETIRVSWLRKSSAHDGLAMWLAAEWQAGEGQVVGAEGLGCGATRASVFTRYLRSAAFRPIGEDEFNTRLQASASDLRDSLFLPPLAGFVGALLMQEIDRDLIVSLLAEYRDGWLHFYWDSTA
ncbi:hypothetical protein FMZ60_04105 [Alcaligenaceae bacterium SJ-26]|nr:hypothetical protein FMZ60_04105 [Alcaligenaceae bacterium SJ-26]